MGQGTRVNLETVDSGGRLTLVRGRHRDQILITVPVRTNR
jgi:hypothetical protein